MPYSDFVFNDCIFKVINYTCILLNSPFRVTECAFQVFERPFSDTERTFKDTERRLALREHLQGVAETFARRCRNIFMGNK